MEKEDLIHIRQVLDGDNQAYRFLVDKYKTMAFTLAFRIMRNEQDAEEVTQDAFVQAYRNLKKFRQKAGFSTWLYRIVYNASVSKLRLTRERRKDFAVEETVREEVENSFLKEDFIHNRQKIMRQLLDHLSSTDRAIITLYYLDELPVREIAGITGLTGENVKMRLYRSRKKLKEILMEKFRPALDDLF